MSSDMILNFSYDWYRSINNDKKTFINIYLCIYTNKMGFEPKPLRTLMKLEYVLQYDF